jgi:hypothetical protein
MSRNKNEGDDVPPPEEFNQESALFRSSRQDSGMGVAGVDKLWEHLSQMQQKSEPLSEEDENMLSLIIDEAMRGIDIANRYPTFFRKLLANSELREAFLESLDLLEQSRAGSLMTLPVTPSRSLDFLKRDLPQMSVEQKTSQWWRLTWQQTAEQLQRIFSLSDITATPVYRFEQSFLEDDWFTLFHNRADVEGTQFDVALEASQPLEEPLSLRLTALVAITTAPEEENPILLESLQATVKWGAYEAKTPINKKNRAEFPPVPLAAIFDQGGRRVAADLQLTLEPGPADGQ